MGLQAGVIRQGNIKVGSLCAKLDRGPCLGVGGPEVGLGPVVLDWGQVHYMDPV